MFHMERRSRNTINIVVVDIIIIIYLIFSVMCTHLGIYWPFINDQHMIMICRLMCTRVHTYVQTQLTPNTSESVPARVVHKPSGV